MRGLVGPFDSEGVCDLLEDNFEHFTDEGAHGNVNIVGVVQCKEEEETIKSGKGLAGFMPSGDMIIHMWFHVSFCFICIPLVDALFNGHLVDVVKICLCGITRGKWGEIEDREGFNTKEERRTKRLGGPTCSTKEG